MNGKNEAKADLSRRDFLKKTAVGVSAVALAGFGTKEAKAASPPQKWDKEADVVIVGYGGAGAAAAITAHDAGAKVIILEKMPRGKEGGNSRVCGQGVLAPLPEHQELFAAYLKNMDPWDQIPEAVARAAAAEFVKNEAWLNGLGCKMVCKQSSPEIKVPGGESVRMGSHGDVQGPESIWKLIAKNVEDREIEILYGTPGKSLVQTCDGEIVGVMAESASKMTAVKARRGVVLTCGGFEFNEAMLNDYETAPTLHFGTPANTGDGIKMAQAVGADLWHMNGGFMFGSTGAVKVPQYETPVEVFIAGTAAYIFVDKFGRRYMDESKPASHGQGWNEQRYFNLKEMTYPRIPWYLVFDEKTRKTKQLFRDFMDWSAIIEGFRASANNTAELERGWILRSDSIEELGKKILTLRANEGKMKPSVLAATLTRYNEFCTRANDLEFGRDAGTLVPIDSPPYYAIELYPGSRNTQGGPRRDERGRIVDVWGKPIRRLYSAGELGSIWARFYQGAGNFGECFAFGRISGRNAAAEVTWS